MHLIVDTNLPLVANDRISRQASRQCVTKCVQKIREIQQKHIVVLDDGWRIVKEYMNKLNSSGQPGVGDAFLKWILTNQYNPQRCELVPLTVQADSEDGNDFKEFPDDPDLAKFDRSDRKFVAVALAHPQKPPILNATDSDWWHDREALAKVGITIEFVCPDVMRQHRK